MKENYICLTGYKMKRMLFFIVVIACCLTCSGCQEAIKSPGQVSQSGTVEQIYEIVIPNSYMKYSGLDSEEVCSSFFGLGSEYITSVAVVDAGVKLCVTQPQIDRLIQRNNDNIEKYIKEFEAYDERYAFKGTSDYSLIELYCDEKLDDQDVFTVLAVSSSTYALNNILYYKSSEWDVNIRVINCHTSKVAIEGSVLTDDMTLNYEVWERTYQDCT